MAFLLCGASGAFAAGLLITFAGQEAAADNIGQYVQEFFRSPGFGGLAALGAAFLAYRGLQGQIATSRDALTNQTLAEENQKAANTASRWWATFQWTADRALPPGKQDVPLPEDVAVATLSELAVTATDDAQRTACAGLVNVIGAPEKQTSPDSPSDDGKDRTEEAGRPGNPSRSVTTAGRARRDAFEQRWADGQTRREALDAALSQYASATRDLPAAESSVASRRAYERATRNAIADIAANSDFEYESSSLLGLWGDPDLAERYQVDGSISRRGGREMLLEVAAFESSDPRSVHRLRSLADNSSYPVIIVSPAPLPASIAPKLNAPEHWIQWSPDDGETQLRQALERAVEAS